MTSWVQTITILVGVGSLTGMFWRAMNMRFEAVEARLVARMEASVRYRCDRIDALNARIDAVARGAR